MDEIINLSSAPLPDPTSLSEALNSSEGDNWLEATVSEVCSLLSKGTFEVVDIPDGKKPVAVKWVFKRKFDAFGNFLKYKVRLVAKGFLQQFGVDYDDVFSPVTKLATLRVLLSLTAAQDLELQHVDIATAFLNGDLTNEVYVAVPDGLKDLYPGKCFRLRKAIYGLKQAPRVWWLNLSSTLAAHDFKPTFADQCLFMKRGKQGMVYCLVYVDDMLFAGTKVDVDEAVTVMLQSYEATQSDANSFLGMGIKRDRTKRTISLSQPNYVDDMAKKLNFSTEYANRSVSIPMSTGEISQGEPLPPDNQFASLIGSLLYLANCTRPDIAFAVNTLARHLRTPHHGHMRMAKQVLRYCIATRDFGLVFGPGTSEADVEIIGFSDSDYANATLPVSEQTVTRRSVSGYIFLANQTPVAWQSKRQPTVARSSDDAEYAAMAGAASTGLWLRKLLAEISGSVRTMQLYGDNQATLKHIEAPGSLNKSKHVDVAYQFVLDRAIRNDLKFTYVKSVENVADILTKALGGVAFSYLRKKMGVEKIYS
jgi:hypothetical protein